MEDRTPKIFSYIRLMQDIPCIGRIVDGKASLDCNLNLSNKVRCDISESFNEKIRFGIIELEADEHTKLRVERIIKNSVPEVEEPQFTDLPDLSHFNSWEEALSEQEELNKQIVAYRDYVENCNSLKLLYNLLTPEVNEYLNKRKIIAGTGFSVGGYDKLTGYYQDIANCKNLMKRGCEKIIVSVENGTIINIQLIGRKGKDLLDIPLLDKNTMVRCRINPHEDTMSLLSDRALPKQNLSLQLLNLFIDPKNVWENVNKMSFHYEPDSDYLYTFAEIQGNIMSYLQAVSEHEIREKNTFTQDICNRLGCLYRFIIECKSINIRKREDAWNFICDLWNFDGDIRVSAYEYILKFRKDKLPIQFTIKPK